MKCFTGRCQDCFTEQFVIITLVMPKSFSHGSRPWHTGPCKTQSKTAPGLNQCIQETIRNLAWRKHPDWGGSDVVTC